MYVLYEEQCGAAAGAWSLAHIDIRFYSCTAAYCLHRHVSLRF